MPLLASMRLNVNMKLFRKIIAVLIFLGMLIGCIYWSGYTSVRYGYSIWVFGFAKMIAAIIAAMIGCLIGWLQCKLME